MATCLRKRTGVEQLETRKIKFPIRENLASWALTLRLLAHLIQLLLSACLVWPGGSAFRSGGHYLSLGNLDLGDLKARPERLGERAAGVGSKALKAVDSPLQLYLRSAFNILLVLTAFSQSPTYLIWRQYSLSEQGGSCERGTTSNRTPYNSGRFGSNSSVSPPCEGFIQPCCHNGTCCSSSSILLSIHSGASPLPCVGVRTDAGVFFFLIFLLFFLKIVIV